MESQGEQESVEQSAPAGQSAQSAHLHEQLGDDHFRSLVEASHDFIGTVDRSGNFLYLNPAGRRLLEIPLDESLVGQSVAPYNAPPSDELASLAASILERGEAFSPNVFVTRSGRNIPVSQSFMAHKTTSGTVYSTIARDMTSRIAIEDELREQADRDPLTGLLNRAAVRRLVQEHRISQNAQVAIADLDRFKQVNDTYGHHRGDELLVEVADALRRVLPHAMVARFGGDEFVICADSADDLPSLIHAALDSLLETYGAGVSVGSATLTTSGAADFESALREADTDLYRHKHAGRHEPALR